MNDAILILVVSVALMAMLIASGIDAVQNGDLVAGVILITVSAVAVIGSVLFTIMICRDNNKSGGKS